MSATDAVPDRITGVFQYWPESVVERGPEEWARLCRFLRGLGMDTLIVQFSVIRGKAYYPSQHFSMVREGADAAGRLLTAAAAEGIGVHLGLASDDEHWWQIPYRPQELPAYVEREAARNSLISEEILDRYGDSPALAGIYLSHEIHLGEEWAGDNLRHLVELFNRMSDGVKRLAPDLPVSTAPFFSLRGTIEEFEQRWRAFLSQTRLDILMLQDGVGCEREITVDHLDGYYAALARVCAETGVEFWTDLELFDLKPPKVAPPARVAAQLAAVAPHVKKVVAYSVADLAREFAALLPGIPSEGLQGIEAGGYWWARHASG